MGTDSWGFLCFFPRRTCPPSRALAPPLPAAAGPCHSAASRAACAPRRPPLPSAGLNPHPPAHNPPLRPAEASPEEFFVPYVWSLAVAQGGIPFALPAIQLFAPSGAPG